MQLVRCHTLPPLDLFIVPSRCPPLIQSICRENAEDFVVESMYCCRVSELAPPERETVAAFIDRIERTWCFR
jgi:hypothetical protein